MDKIRKQLVDIFGDDINIKTINDKSIDNYNIEMLTFKNGTSRPLSNKIYRITANINIEQIMTCTLGDIQGDGLNYNIIKHYTIDIVKFMSARDNKGRLLWKQIPRDTRVVFKGFKPIYTKTDRELLTILSWHLNIISYN
jgi:hypothetical protein